MCVVFVLLCVLLDPQEQRSLREVYDTLQVETSRLFQLAMSEVSTEVRSGLFAIACCVCLCGGGGGGGGGALFCFSD